MEDELTKRELLAFFLFAAMHARDGDGDERFAVLQADRLLAELKPRKVKKE